MSPTLENKRMPLEIPTNSVVIPPRQREPEIDDYFLASVSRRLIQPIVLRQTDEGPTLVVGARRLLALRKLNIDLLVEGEHFRFIHNLSPEDAMVVELEENLKRKDMAWREQAQAIFKIHKVYSTRPGWNYTKTMAELSISQYTLHSHLIVARNLNEPLLADAKSVDHAYSIIRLAASRAAGDIVSKISETGSEVFEERTEAVPVSTPTTEISLLISTPIIPSEVTKTSPTSPIIIKPNPIQPAQSDPILCTSFQTWLSGYTGPKFNLIHCDFPYGVDYKKYGASVTTTDEDYDPKVFDDLLSVFTTNLDRFCSYQAHVIFWFSMEFYEKTRLALKSTGLDVQRHPLVWFKSDNKGIVPRRDNQYPRRVYETAFLCSRGNRSLIKPLSNLYAAPVPSNSIHPSQKNESMLKHFLSMFVDNTTDVFDPTCGSGAALRAADSLGARCILGLEIHTDYARRANQTTISARSMRKAAQ